VGRIGLAHRAGRAGFDGSIAGLVKGLIQPGCLDILGDIKTALCARNQRQQSLFLVPPRGGTTLIQITSLTNVFSLPNPRGAVTLTPNAQYIISVKCTPVGTATTASGRLAITHNAAGSPLTIPLSYSPENFAHPCSLTRTPFCRLESV
jgi:hypothetical protein